jgi:hypothetical protein
MADTGSPASTEIWWWRALRPVLLLILALLIAFSCGGGLPWILFVLPPVAYRLGCSRINWMYCLACTVFFTPVFAFTWGAATYCLGVGELREMGYMPLRPIDRETRLQFSTGGCSTIGFEEFASEPHNFALVAFSKIFGPMRGTYRGPFPSRTEALTLIEKAGRPVDPQALDSGRIEFGGQTFLIDDRLRKRIEDAQRFSECPEYRCVTAALTPDAGLVVGIGSAAQDAADKWHYGIMVYPIAVEQPLMGRTLTEYGKRW